MPWSRVLAFSDPFTYQASIRASDVELYPIAKGGFGAELTQINLHRVWMQRFHEKLPEVFTSRVKPGRKVIGFLTDTNQPNLQHCGIGLSPHEIIICNRDVMHQRSEGGCRFGTMSLAIADFDAACVAITGRDLSTPPLNHVVRPSADLMSRLTRLHQTTGEIAKSTPEFLTLAEVARSVEQQLIHLMIRCLTEGLSSRMTAGGRRHDAIVARFEEFLEANPDQPLYLTEICAAIGVAERTLRAACEQHLGMGPIRYLSLRRMHLVRRALLHADPAKTTVTRVATDHGFWELGRFSVAYRALFDESPSETLHHLREDKAVVLNRPSSLLGSTYH